jgi:hypothetical protein
MWQQYLDLDKIRNGSVFHWNNKRFVFEIIVSGFGHINDLRLVFYRYYVIIKSMIWYLIEQSDWAMVGSSRLVSIHAFCQQLFAVLQALSCLWLQAYQLPRLGWYNRFEIASKLVECVLTAFQMWLGLVVPLAEAFVELWVILLRVWLLSMCSWFEPR